MASNRLGSRGQGRRRPAIWFWGAWVGCAWVGCGATTLAAEELDRPREAVVAAPLSASEAARTMEVPEGFRVTVYAAEPDVRQPVGMCMDDRGRLYVAEAHHYPQHGLEPGDQIVILEDPDGDGTSDRRTVFTDQVNYVTGIEVGFGGVWVMSPPYLLFFADRDGDDRPDGPPQVLLDGFGNHANSHNLANSLAWGPDGWLYGTHGRTNWSLIGRPGTPAEQRNRFDGGVYRYHPVRHVWQAYADGTTNPWGIDWNDLGEAFVCNCVTPHLYHVIRGAHYEPWRNRESSRYAYQRIATIADHRHFAGAAGDVRAELGSAAESLLGGGHAHCGTLIYLGDTWPSRYRNTVLMHNIHGHRINNDQLVRQGSGYVGKHGADLMLSRDPWYMGVSLLLGPDGAVYSADWSDTGECHSMVNTHRETGRVFKISYGPTTPPQQDLQQRSTLELVELQLHPNDWYVRHARRILQERALAGTDVEEGVAALRRGLGEHAEVTRRLRCLWTLHAMQRTDRALLQSLLADTDEHVRAWAVRLVVDDPTVGAELGLRLGELARTEPASVVRLHLSSALQQLPLDDRWSLAEALLARSEDTLDANLPLMIWYGIEPLADRDPSRFVRLAAGTELPYVREHIARRLLEPTSGRELATSLSWVVEVLGDAELPTTQFALLSGMLNGLAGVRSCPQPAEWNRVFPRLQLSADDSVRQVALEVALVFDDPQAVALLRQRMADRQLASRARQHAVHLLVAKRAPDLVASLLELLDDPELQRTVVRSLAEFEHASIPDELLTRYARLEVAARQDTLQTLAARRPWAVRLIDEVVAGRVPRADLTAYTIRQLTSLGDDQLNRRITELWGTVRESPAEKRTLIQAYRRRYTAESLESADRRAGRGVFQQSCAQCHRLFDAGGELGPDLTGAQRSSLDYLFENLIDPSAMVAADYQMEVLETTDGRVITGLVVDENSNQLTVQSINSQVVVPRNEVHQRDRATVSFMPDGLLSHLTDQQRRDLLAYLRGGTQVPLPPSAP